MANNNALFESLRVTTDGGTMAVDVPWQQAEALQTFLRQKELTATICLDPRTHEARLEMHPGTDEASLRSALKEWQESPAGRP